MLTKPWHYAYGIWLPLFVRFLSALAVAWGIMARGTSPVAMNATSGLFSNSETIAPQKFSSRVWGSDTYPAGLAHSALAAVFESMQEDSSATLIHYQVISRGHLETIAKSHSRKGIMCNQLYVPYAA
jgi:hypothetical protein